MFSTMFSLSEVKYKVKWMPKQICSFCYSSAENPLKVGVGGGGGGKGVPGMVGIGKRPLVLI